MLVLARNWQHDFSKYCEARPSCVDVGGGAVMG